MDNWRIDWVKDKQNIASKLYSGECGGSYAEAVIILCSVISAIATEVWPGKGIDRRRFVELLKEYSDKKFNATKISIPLLIGYLRLNGEKKDADLLEKAFMDFCFNRVLTGSDIDRFENEISPICNTLSLKEIRKCSYSNILYEEVRSSYVHEYQSGKKADPWPMTSKEGAGISYVNWVNDPNRHIHFHIDWLSGIILSVVESIALISESLPLKNPVCWWIDG